MTNQAHVEEAKAASLSAVELRMPELVAVSRAIHDRPELCFEEHHAAALLCQSLEDAGFRVEPGVFGLPTAFRAQYGSGDLSVLICAEYDALAGVGHACGHNVIAAAALGAGIGLARVADQVGITVTVLGTPAEEGGGGKVILLERGAFDGVHAAMMVHPWHEDRLGATCLAVDHLEVSYVGREAHASAAPHHGINAGDALVVAQVAIGLLRQQLPFGHQVHFMVTNGGDAVNIIPRLTTARCMVRAPTLDGLVNLRQRVERCFEAGALSTGCELAIREVSPTYSDYVADGQLLDAWKANAERLGRRYDADSSNEPLPTISTDMANVSRAVPSIHPLIGLDAQGVGIHHPAFAAAAAGPSSEMAVHDGAVAMAWTAIDAATSPETRQHLLSRR